MPWWMQLGNKVAAPIMLLLQKTPPQGAYCSIYAATDPDLPFNENTSGQLLFHCRVSQVSDIAKKSEVAIRLWSISEELTKLI